MSETELSKSILDALNLLHGCRFWRSPSGRERGGRQNIGPPKGTPDIIGYVGSPYADESAFFAAFEIKLPETVNKKSGTTYAAQKAWRDRADKDGAYVWVVTSAKQAVELVSDIQEG